MSRYEESAANVKTENWVIITVVTNVGTPVKLQLPLIAGSFPVPQKHSFTFNCQCTQESTLLMEDTVQRGEYCE